jgi:phage terminase small subunit
LTEKQERFCREYIIDLNATQAAIRAGYSKKTAGAIGFEYLKKPEIKSRIEQLQYAAMMRADLTADMVINELRSLAFWSIKDFVEDDNAIKDISSMDRIVLKPVVGIKKTDRYDPEGNAITVTELKLADKRASLVDLGKHLGIFKEDNNQKAIRIKVTRK